MQSIPLQTIQDYCKDKEVLDIACGCGYGSGLLSEVATSIIGGDYSQEAINYANVNWKKPNIEFKIVNIKDTPILGQFDTVISFETLEHINHAIEKTILFYKSNLKPGGTLIFSHPENEEDAKNNPFHHHFNILSTNMQAMVESLGFEVIEIKQQAGYKGYYDYSIYILKLIE